MFPSFQQQKNPSFHFFYSSDDEEDEGLLLKVLLVEIAAIDDDDNWDASDPLFEADGFRRCKKRGLTISPHQRSRDDRRVVNNMVQ